MGWADRIYNGILLYSALGEKKTHKNNRKKKQENKGKSIFDTIRNFS